jgi:hypothetical protein
MQRVAASTIASQLCLLVLCLAWSVACQARDGEAVWNSRCEECHSEVGEFAGKYLWYVDGQLQGQHHVVDLDLFLGNHYIPDHEIDIIHQLLTKHANSMQRYHSECAECHAAPGELLEQSLWVTTSGVRVIKSGQDIEEFLKTHLARGIEETAYYLQLFTRIAAQAEP